ncbi:PilX N-terminal domain-containing pilus assembly protein [Alkalibacter mobilis]|uniref:PilX N-terminal domain-containing pilus assembly protein n=1 Tax=Alkalibacter mobilis TaxID=2787712 RepID=UPI0018A0E949|nr:PilX N-terminal domain-containing pilus assembly protein [Alkalibacter mobilis]MBF7095754.1 hypothetical protein [Alkalibacter mobilis]
MIKFGLKEKDGGILILTLIIILLLEVLVISLMPLSMMQHKSILNYRDHIQLEKLAEAGKTEAYLNAKDDWSENLQTDWVHVEGIGYYSVTTFDDGADTKKILIKVKDSNIERSYEGRIYRQVPENNFANLLKYTLYSDSELLIGDISKIRDQMQSEGVAVNGNLKIKNIRDPNSLKLNVNGNIYTEEGIGKSFISQYPVSRDVTPKFLVNSIYQYKNLLISEFGDKIEVTENMSFSIFDQNYFDKGCDVFYFDSIDDLKITNATFNGVLIIDGCNRVRIDNLKLDGVLMVFNADMVDLANTAINGAVGLMGTHMEEHLDLEINYDYNNLESLRDYLEFDFGSVDFGNYIYSISKLTEVG